MLSVTQSFSYSFPHSVITQSPLSLGLFPMGHNLLLLSEDTEVLGTRPTHQGVSCIRRDKHVDAYACVQNEKWLQQKDDHQIRRGGSQAAAVPAVGRALPPVWLQGQTCRVTAGHLLLPHGSRGVWGMCQFN